MTQASGVPYFSQWESPDLVPQFIDGSLRAAAYAIHQFVEVRFGPRLKWALIRLAGAQD